MPVARKVWIAGTVREFMTRWHTGDGRATKTVVHLDLPGDVFSLTPTEMGRPRRSRSTSPRLADPGDRGSRVIEEVGEIYLGNESGNGVVVHDTGSVTFEAGAEIEEIAP